jgi:hypothetical protein
MSRDTWLRRGAARLMGVGRALVAGSGLYALSERIKCTVIPYFTDSWRVLNTRAMPNPCLVRRPKSAGALANELTPSFSIPRRCLACTAEPAHGSWQIIDHRK